VIDWRGICAVILAVGLSIAIGANTIIIGLNANRTLSIEEASLVAGVFGAIIGALASYLGGRPPQDKDRNPPP
jgi:energy-converting hydrogenase Eha subunit A